MLALGVPSSSFRRIVPAVAVYLRSNTLRRLARSIFKFQEDRASRRSVFDLLPADLQGMLGLNDFFLRNGGFLFFFRLFHWFFRLRRLLLLGEAEIRPKEKQSDGT